MSRSVGNQLPASLRPLFAGTDIEAHEGLTFVLLTVGEEGYPHPALLSVGEVVGLPEEPSTLHLALWTSSTATRNLAGEGRATLLLVYEQAGYYVRGTARRGEDLTLPMSGGLAYFRFEIEDILEDVAPYAVLESGVTFRLKQPDQVYPRWREAVTALRERAGTA